MNYSSIKFELSAHRLSPAFPRRKTTKAIIESVKSIFNTFPKSSLTFSRIIDGITTSSLLPSLAFPHPSPQLILYQSNSSRANPNRSWRMQQISSDIIPLMHKWKEDLIKLVSQSYFGNEMPKRIAARTIELNPIVGIPAGGRKLKRKTIHIPITFDMSIWEIDEYPDKITAVHSIRKMRMHINFLMSGIPIFRDQTPQTSMKMIMIPGFGVRLECSNIFTFLPSHEMQGIGCCIQMCIIEESKTENEHKNKNSMKTNLEES